MHPSARHLTRHDTYAMLPLQNRRLSRRIYLELDIFSRILGITLIDLVLSGDNAVIIGMAAHRLPDRQRKLAIILGAAGAVGLRVFNTAVASVLLSIPVLQAAGGLLLIWIAFKLLKDEGDKHGQTKVADGLRAAVQTILVADFVMSLDNVLAVAGVAGGDLPLLLFGLGLSIPIVVFGGGLVAFLINRLWWLAYVGSAVIAWTGMEMVIKDKTLHDSFTSVSSIEWLLPGLTVCVVLTVSYWFYGRSRRATNQPSAAIAPDVSSETPVV